MFPTVHLLQSDRTVAGFGIDNLSIPYRQGDVHFIIFLKMIGRVRFIVYLSLIFTRGYAVIWRVHRDFILPFIWRIIRRKSTRLIFRMNQWWALESLRVIWRLMMLGDWRDYQKRNLRKSWRRNRLWQCMMRTQFGRHLMRIFVNFQLFRQQLGNLRKLKW